MPVYVELCLGVHGVELAHKTDDELIPTKTGFEIKGSLKKELGQDSEKLTVENTLSIYQDQTLLFISASAITSGPIN